MNFKKIVSIVKLFFMEKNIFRRLLRVAKQYVQILLVAHNIRKNDILVNYFLSPQYSDNSWSFNQCKQFGLDFEKAYYDTEFIYRFSSLLRGLARNEEYIIKFIFFRMLFLSFLNKSSLFLPEEIALFDSCKSSINNEYDTSDKLNSNFKFVNNHYTAHVFRDNLGLNLVSSYIDPNKSIIDVGAYVGDSSLVLSKFTKNNVYAFEPFLETFNDLSKNILLNNVTNIIPVNMGVSSLTGKTNLYFSDNNPSISTNDPALSLSKGACNNSIEINVTTIDAFTKSNGVEVGIIKIDAEGAEQAVLLGAIETIRKHKPILLISIYHNIDDFMNIKPWVDELGLGYNYKISKPEASTFIEETMLVCY